MESSKDPQLKFAKLAAEYSKLRSQIPVLKKAFTEEQTRCNELKEMLRVKDQNLRIAECETDSLTFRNQQLTRRVSILLQELEELKNRNKKYAHKSQIEQQGKHDMMDEEFSKIIGENAELISSLNECKEKYENDVKELNSIISQLKHELSITSGTQKDSKLTKVTIKDEEEMDVTEESSSRAGTGIYDKDDLPRDSVPNGKQYRIEKDPKEDNEEETVGNAIQKALQDRLLIVEQFNNKIKHENVQLTSEKKNLEAKLKELIAKYEVGQSQLLGATNYIPTEETYARECEIKAYYEGEIKSLKADLKYAKSCIDTYYKEIQNIKFRLDSEQTSRMVIEKNCDKIQLERANMEEELKTTKANYETQISTMSEHIASLLDKIQQQKDQIDEFTYQLETKKMNKKK